MVPDDKLRSFRIFMRTAKMSDLPKPSEIEGAYDSAEGLGWEGMSDKKKLRFLARLRGKVSDAGLLTIVDALLGRSDDEDDGAQDEPPPFSGRPLPGGKLDPLSNAMDALPARLRGLSSDRNTKDRSARDFEARFPEAMRIGVGPAISTRAG
jgi:hypothetical protein